MGTAAVIRVEGSELEVYKHFDGYPEGTLPWLKSFNEDFSENRKNDPDYKMAQLLRDSVRSGDTFNLDGSHYTGWGVSTKGTNGYCYLYTLKEDGTVEISK